jgi:hypothetical protein
MFWVYLLIAIVAFVAVVGWFGRKRGSAKGKPNADLDANVWRARAQARGSSTNYTDSY